MALVGIRRDRISRLRRNHGNQYFAKSRVEVDNRQTLMDEVWEQKNSCRIWHFLECQWRDEVLANLGMKVARICSRNLVG